MRAYRGALALVAGLGTLTFAGNALAAPAVPEAGFAMTNAADHNEIVGYREKPDGSGYDVHRYETGGRGSGGVTDPLGSQGSLVLSQDKSLLFAVNAGSGDISTFSVNNGRLQLLDITPSGGSSPVAVAQWGKLLYVVNAGGYGSVVAFRIRQDGTLKQIANSTVNLNGDLGGGSSATIRPDGKFLVVTERGFNNIDTFTIGPDGTLGPIVVNQSKGPGAFSAQFDAQGILLVSETGPATVADGSAISSYSINGNGTLAVITQSLPTFGGANCWNAITPDNKRVYASNAGSSTISGFNIGSTGALTPIGATTVGTNPAGSTNIDIAISGDGKYLFSLNSGTGTVSIFGIGSDGTLSLLVEVPGLPASEGINGLAVL
jgi:6-phosphogluconolactonase (cycloisomerase 2 family)